MSINDNFIKQIYSNQYEISKFVDEILDNNKPEPIDDNLPTRDREDSLMI